MKVAFAAAVLVLLFLGSAGAAVGISLDVYHRQDQGWCEMLGLLTGHPVPRPTAPAANPSRELAWRWYQAARARERQLGC